MRPTARMTLLLCLVPAAASMLVRPAWPVDETRYLGVAWGMWERGDLLLPRLNGGLYSDKPPLLFWLMHAGWALFGVNDWWPRLFGPLAALLAAWLTSRLARRLFAEPSAAAGTPDAAPPGAAGSVADLAPLLLCGSLLFAAWTTFLMFDTLLVVATLVALLGLVAARQDGGARAWLLCGAGIGAGLLLKGPVLLLHVLPAALTVGWWAPAPRASGARDTRGARGGRWAAGLALALLLGAGLALLWVVPAGLAGGEVFRDELLWGQASQRLVNGEAVPHAEPWWFYLPWLAVLLFPWCLWPRLWRAAAEAARRPRIAARADSVAAPPSSLPEDAVRPSVIGARFCLAWALPALLLLSAIGSKQEQYLLPEVPALALLGAALLVGHARRAERVGDGAAASRQLAGTPARHGRRGEAALPGLALLAIGGAIAWAGHPSAPPPLDHADLVGTHSAAGLALAAVGLALVVLPLGPLARTVRALACSSAALLLAVFLSAPPGSLAQRDVRPAAAMIAALQAEGRPLAYLGRYRAQYDFYGRLNAPFTNLSNPRVPKWFAEHPRGVLVEPRAWRADGAPAPRLRALVAFPSGEQFWELNSPELR